MGTNDRKLLHLDGRGRTQPAHVTGSRISYGSQYLIGLKIERRVFVKNCKHVQQLASHYSPDECLERLISTNCNCTLGLISYSFDFSLAKDLCMENNRACVNQMKESAASQCQKPCNQTIYHMSIKSPIQLENDLMHLRLRETLNLTVDDTGLARNDEKLREKIAFFSIYFESFTVQTNTESWRFENAVSYMADMGGTLGFLFGGSIFCIIQLVEACLLCSLRQCCQQIGK